MVFSLPYSAAIPDVSAANAAAASAISSSSAVSGPARLFTSAVHANNFRLTIVYSRLSAHLNGVARFEASEVIGLCYTLAKAIDCSLTLKDIPGIAPRLPPLVKKVYEWRKHAALQSAIMMVLISMKNACKRGWFQPADSGELLCIVDEMCSKFCTELCPNDQANYAFDTISKIMPKFYPRLKLCSLIAAFEAKPGYDVLMSDFHFPKNKFMEQKIVLVVLKTENLETSSCIASPPQVSFLINGRGVEKRNTVSLDCGPQFPTDISKMLKYGINVIQTIGYFDGTYLIAVAYMSRMTPFTLPALKDFVQPVVAALDSDSEIIEGPSRISLNCPISFKRITIPVKGHLCKHHQCFDYVNFMEMNSRKPIWHCPHCNQPVCVIDLRIDQNMVKILEEVGKDVAEVIIHADSSWNVVAEHKSDTNLLHDQADMECEANRPRNSMADPVDLTMEEEVSLDGSARQICKPTSENEDRKPFIGDGVIPISRFVASHASNAAQMPALQMGNVMQPTFMPSSVLSPLGISQSLPPPNVLANATNDRGPSSRRGLTDLDAFLASVQPPSFAQNSHQTPSGFWTHHSIRQVVNALPQSPSLPLAPWLGSPSTSVMGADRWRSLTGGTPSQLSRPDVFQELPSEQHNSTPARIMRGRLTGNDYSAVLNRYMAPPTGQSAATRPTFSSSIPPTAHDQVSALIANNLMARGAASQRANLTQDNFGTQQGDTCI